jgi:hypothetical protein
MSLQWREFYPRSLAFIATGEHNTSTSTFLNPVKFAPFEERDVALVISASFFEKF